MMTHVIMEDAELEKDLLGWNFTWPDSNDAFINVGDSIVSHGGIAIEEVIVPLVKIERRTL